MSTKSSQGPHTTKNIFSGRMVTVAVIIGVVFLTTILVYPRIFNPSNIGKNTTAAPVAQLPGAAAHP